MKASFALLKLTLVAALVVVLDGTAAACGSADSAMPDPEPCPATTPASPTGFGRRDQPGTFRQTVNQDVSRIEKLTSDFRQQYPGGKFYRGSFRPDFARYIDGTICIARSLRDLTPSGNAASTKAALDTALGSFIDFQGAGREAVRSRNVSGYKDWYNGFEVQLGALRAAPSVGP